VENGECHQWRIYRNKLNPHANSPLSTIHSPLELNYVLLFQKSTNKEKLMLARFIHEGKSIDFFPDTITPAGSVIVLGSLVGVTKLDLPAGQMGAVHVVGVYDIVKSNVAIPLGSKVYWDTTAKQAVLTSTGNPLLGVAVAAAAADETLVRVRLG
jgi:predicted RecA/RadA family phage recombinase